MFHQGVDIYEVFKRSFAISSNFIHKFTHSNQE